MKVKVQIISNSPVKYNMGKIPKYHVCHNGSEFCENGNDECHYYIFTLTKNHGDKRNVGWRLSARSKKKCRSSPCDEKIIIKKKLIKYILHQYNTLYAKREEICVIFYRCFEDNSVPQEIEQIRPLAEHAHSDTARTCIVAVSETKKKELSEIEERKWKKGLVYKTTSQQKGLFLIYPARLRQSFTFNTLAQITTAWAADIVIFILVKASFNFNVFFSKTIAHLGYLIESVDNIIYRFPIN